MEQKSGKGTTASLEIPRTSQNQAIQNRVNNSQIYTLHPPPLHPLHFFTMHRRVRVTILAVYEQ